MTIDTEKELISRDDFMTGLILGLASEGVKSVSITEVFDPVIEKVYESFLAEYESTYKVRFRIRTHPIHGDSLAVQKALNSLAARQIVSFEGDSMRIRVSVEEADAILHSLPGEVEIYKELASRFSKLY